MKHVSFIMYLAGFGSLFAGKADLVELIKLDPTFVLDIRYATDNNFTKQVLYESSRAFLVKEAAVQLVAVQKELRTNGLGLKIWDAYRPFQVQRKLWALFPDPQFVAEPIDADNCSRHNRGCAVDVTLVRLSDGQELEMPTGFDDFSERAHRTYKDLPQQAIENREELERVMTKHGFVGYDPEWWHFDFGNYKNYKGLDDTFENLP